MGSVPMEAGLLLAGVLLAMGLVGVLVRRNIVFMLVCIEVMLNAAALALVVAGARWGQADGQVAFLFVLCVSAAEVAVGLALVLRFHHRFRTLDTRAADTMKG